MRSRFLVSPDGVLDGIFSNVEELGAALSRYGEPESTKEASLRVGVDH